MFLRVIIFSQTKMIWTAISYSDSLSASFEDQAGSCGLVDGGQIQSPALLEYSNSNATVFNEQIVADGQLGTWKCIWQLKNISNTTDI